MRNILFLLLIFGFLGCQKNIKSSFLEGQAFGTTYHIRYFSDKGTDLQSGIDSVINSINKSVSTYDSESDISKINQGDSTVVVDSFFREVLEISSRIHRESEGYFDPTIGVLRNAYGFGEVKPIEIDSIALDSMMKYVGFDKVKLLESGRIHKEYPEIYFDFNAVAKGSGVDHIGLYLEKNGIKNYLVEVGGEIRARGKNLETNLPWTVGIETPDSELENRQFTATVRLNDEALAASGNYRKYRIDPSTGRKFVHTINPLTGSAEMSDVTSATVIAETCGEADAYATAFMAMGFEKSVSLLKKLPKVEAYLTYVDEQGENQVYITDGFKERMPE